MGTRVLVARANLQRHQEPKVIRAMVVLIWVCHRPPSAYVKAKPRVWAGVSKRTSTVIPRVFVDDQNCAEKLMLGRPR